MIKYFIKKYSTFLKYILVAGISFLIDITFFTVFNTTFKVKIIYATIMARVISSFINYILNKDKVFKSDEGRLKTIIKYYILVVVQMFISAFVVDNLHKVVKINAAFIKVPVEFILFVCNYLIQKLLIFKRSDKNDFNKK